MLAGHVFTEYNGCQSISAPGASTPASTITKEERAFMSVLVDRQHPKLPGYFTVTMIISILVLFMLLIILAGW
jgi:hypothetical protein